jgi:RNA polymerase sigma factor (sigma-70 family)
MERDEGLKFMYQLLTMMVQKKGSDLFITAGFPPAIKVDGRVTPATTQTLTPQHTMELARAIMNDRQAAEFEAKKECNFAINPTGIGRFRGDEATLRPWLLQIAIRTARKCLRRRATRRFLGLRTPGELPEIADASDPEQQTALGRAQLALLRLPADLRIAFGLRWIAGMQLDEVAAACEVSLATAKRRLAQARARFERVAARDPVLASWLREVAS